MSKQRVFLTGATGGMGLASLKEMLKDADKQDIVILARDSEKNRKILDPYRNTAGLEIVWGDLNDYDVVLKCVKDCDLILHIAAFVSPAADYHPKQAMKVNYGSTRNLINAIYALGQQDKTRLVYIGTVAETGDRMPPIHWGRVGDPIKPSMFDYYAVSKVAANGWSSKAASSIGSPCARPVSLASPWPALKMPLCSTTVWTMYWNIAPTGILPER